jgi:hypothetical protein
MVVITAKILIKGDENPIGTWDFVDLPRDGELLAVRINDEPAVFQVAGVIHVPAVHPSISPEKATPPTVDLVVVKYGVDI